MFRAQQNAFDEAVAKATDENLTSENWEYILDVCDKANGEDSGPKEVVGAMIKRLAHRNANVQLYTLELANSLSQNCGPKVHRELSSRSFTDALLRLAGDRNTHQQVKAKILERMAEWTEMFSKDPDLGIMEQAYMKLKTQNPNLQPPSKPTKRQITDVDRQKEEEELQMALELSVKDRQPSVSAGQDSSSGGGRGASNQQQPAQVQPVSSGTTAATISRVRALFDFQPSEPGELQFKKGDIIAVLESVYKDWWKGSLRGQTGIFPLNYVEKLSDPTPDQLQREAHMESEVFAEIKNVEKLLTLLSTSNSELNVRDNEEITTLYHSTLAIRPKLIELIGKYSQRKDDFTQLNEKFIKARRDYESLLEASMSQPQQSAYGRPGPYGYGGATSGYPPQGLPPQQHDPGRYYSPNPADSRTSQLQYPPQNGPQPFHMAPGPQGQPQYAHVDPRARTPSGSVPPPSDTYSHHPQTTYDHPQELGTTSYHSPIDTRPQQAYPPSQSQFPSQQQPLPQQHQQPPGDFSPSGPSGYSPESPRSDQHPPPGAAQQGYPAPLQQAQQAQQMPYPSSDTTPYPSSDQQPYVSANQAPPPQPSYQPPKVPSPGVGGNPYPNLGAPPPPQQQGGPGGQPQYQAYQPPKQQGQPQPGYVGGIDPNDYYR